MTPKDVLQTIEKNIAKQNRFNMKLNLPSLSELSYFDTNKEIFNYYIQDASLPSQNITLSEVSYLGKTKYAFLNKEVDSIVCSLYDNKEQTIRNMFIEYHNAIVPDNKIGTLKYFPDEYQTTLNITIHDKQYDIFGASPISIGDFRLSHTSQDTLGTFDVTFKVKQVKEI